MVDDNPGVKKLASGEAGRRWHGSELPKILAVRDSVGNSPAPVRPIRPEWRDYPKRFSDDCRRSKSVSSRPTNLNASSEGRDELPRRSRSSINPRIRPSGVGISISARVPPRSFRSKAAYPPVVDSRCSRPRMILSSTRKSAGSGVVKDVLGARTEEVALGK